ncbi:ComEA family DNA-binding protein [Actinoplanes sp. NPDC051633]|uniref:ComEA family DNA-binding protein n=1 Tax=Actinoplanes sp. NPDC051633 TaxID=3155670 RepID=UPI003427F190
MPKRDESDAVVAARLRSVMAAPAAFEDRSPVAWSELIPSWPDDVDLPSTDPQSDLPADLPAGAQPGPPPGDQADLADPAVRPAWTAPRLSAEGSFGGRLAAFDLGRPGVRALAMVAAVVVLIAGFLAWRSRPRVEPIEPPAPAVAQAPPPASSAAPVGEVVVAVGGKVNKPGLKRLPAGARVADALTAAGGAKAGVDPSMLNLARRVVDGELIMVGVTPPPAAAGTSTAAGGPLNLNTATPADLDGLPGVGPVLAQRILDAREAQGGFKAVSDLRKVSGIGSSRYEQLKDLVTV